MTKQQFIQELSECLLNEVDAQEYNNSIQYYTNYIENEVRSGKTEEEVTTALGSPRLIAKTIIDSQIGNSYGNQTIYEEVNTGREKSFQESRENSQEKWQIRIGDRIFDKWYEKVVFAIITVLVIMLILGVLGVAFSILWHVVLPIAAIVILFRLISNFFR